MNKFVGRYDIYCLREQDDVGRVMMYSSANNQTARGYKSVGKGSMVYCEHAINNKVPAFFKRFVGTCITDVESATSFERNPRRGRHRFQSFPRLWFGFSF